MIQNFIYFSYWVALSTHGCVGSQTHACVVVECQLIEGVDVGVLVEIGRVVAGVLCATVLVVQAQLVV